MVADQVPPRRWNQGPSLRSNSVGCSTSSVCHRGEAAARELGPSSSFQRRPPPPPRPCRPGKVERPHPGHCAVGRIASSAFAGLARTGCWFCSVSDQVNLFLNPMALIMGRRASELGSPAGSRKELHEALQFAASHGVRPAYAVPPCCGSRGARADARQPLAWPRSSSCSSDSGAQGPYSETTNDPTDSM